LFELHWTDEAKRIYSNLKSDASQERRYKDVKKTLTYLQTDLRHPSLETHEFRSIDGPNGEKVFEAYAQQKTPAAYRIFWFYGPSRGKITVLTITAHP
jgi:hypothetical protein